MDHQFNRQNDLYKFLFVLRVFTRAADGEGRFRPIFGAIGAFRVAVFLTLYAPNFTESPSNSLLKKQGKIALMT